MNQKYYSADELVQRIREIRNILDMLEVRENELILLWQAATEKGRKRRVDSIGRREYNRALTWVKEAPSQIIKWQRESKSTGKKDFLFGKFLNSRART